MMRRSGQAHIFEYSVLVVVIAAALLLMQRYVRLAIQANLKLLEDRVNAEAVSP